MKDIQGYEGLYAADKYGHIYSLINDKGRRKGMLIPYEKNGYLAVNLYKDGKCKHHYIHRLVAQTFIDNPDNLREVNHKDCNKHNNNVSNLEWCSRRENLQHSYDHGLKRAGEKHGCHKLTEKQVREIRCSKLSQRELALKYGVSSSNINAIIAHRIWKEVMPEC